MHKKHNAKIVGLCCLIVSSSWAVALAEPFGLTASTKLHRIDFATGGAILIGDTGYAGPAVDPSFAVAPIDLPSQGDTVFIAWRDEQGNVHSGLLRLADGSFDAFPIQPTVGGVTNLTVGTGGPPAARRAYVAWVDSQLQLVLLAFDGDGSVVSPPQPVADAVQVTPMRIAGTDEDALIAHAWDGNPNWDPRTGSVDLAGALVGLEVVEDVTQGQTLGVTIAANSSGAHGVVYTVSGTGLDPGTARIRRYTAGGPVDQIPYAFADDVQGAYQPYGAVYEPAGNLPFMLLGIPYNGPTLGSDFRFAYATLGPGEVLVGASLAEMVPAFPGGVADMVGLVGSPELAAVVWQEVELQDPCACSVPPPVRVEFFVQLVLASEAPQAVGSPFSVQLWQEGDPTGPPVTLPRLAPSKRIPGAFTVFWSDGLLRYTTFVPALFEDGFESGDTSAWR